MVLTWYFRIEKKHCCLNIFVECKASEKINAISGNELAQKIVQLQWAGFPNKDVAHTFIADEIGGPRQ